MTSMTPAQRDAQRRKYERAAAQREAAKIRTASKVSASERKAADKIRDAERKAAAKIRDAEAKAEEQALTVPRVRYVGGTMDTPTNTVRIWHWRLESPPEGLAWTTRKGEGLYAGLTKFDPNIGATPFTAAQTALYAAKFRANLPVERFTEWVELNKAVDREVRQRYPLLSELADDRKMRDLFDEAGLLIRKDGDPITVKGTYGTYRKPVKVVRIPTLLEVRITADGLELVYELTGGDTAERWQKALPALKPMFKRLGVQSVSGLSVTTNADMNVVLAFDDAPAAFPAAVSPEPPAKCVGSVDEAIRRYEHTRWMLGKDARGRALSFPMTTQPHVLVVGGTGGGKSVWARSVIETLRTGYTDPDTGKDAGGGWLIWCVDGKGSDYSALDGQPGIAMVAPRSDTALVAVMVRYIREEVAERFETANERKRAGDPDPFRGMQPWLLLIDEFSAMSMEMNSAFGAKASEAFRQDIDLILRLGRECRVHVVLASQTIRKTGPGAVPGSWQENLGLTVSLGTPSEITLQSDAFTDETRPRASVMGARLKGKPGRGLYALRETGDVVEFQSFYAWSPGTTSLDPDAESRVKPPTPEVRETWERWEPVSASVPWVAPRAGVRVPGPDWRGGDKPDLEQAYDLAEIVPITDKNGTVRSGFEAYDPTSPDWIGSARRAGGSSRRRRLGFDDHTETATPRTEPRASVNTDTAPSGVSVCDPVQPEPPRTEPPRTVERDGGGGLVTDSGLIEMTPLEETVIPDDLSSADVMAESMILAVVKEAARRGMIRDPWAPSPKPNRRPRTTNLSDDEEL
ncbi:FtsK/SpoIIIE domain-containing protein [Mycolicibacterium thermoresistibile]